MTAFEKTRQILRIYLPLDRLEKNEVNPNKMSDREFNLLCDNYSRTGLTDPILLRPMDLKGLRKALKGLKSIEEQQEAVISSGGRFRIVGGHHRFDAAAYLDFAEVPVTIIMSDDFDDDQEKFQLVRMNMIRGKPDPEKFFNLYSQLSESYADDILQEAFGFAEQAEFQKLITHAAKALPDKHMQDKFKEAAQEIKTIDGLSKLLNEMFTKYGDTLPFGYMVFDHAGQRSMWLRIEGKTMKSLDVIGDMCIDNNRAVDDVVGSILRKIAKGEFAEVMAEVIAATPPATIPAGMPIAPTKDNLQKVAEA